MGTSMVAHNLPPNIPPLHQDFAEGDRVLETQVAPSMAPQTFLTVTKTSAPLPQGEARTTETTPQPDPYSPGLDPIEAMVALFATMVHYRH